MQKPPLWLSLLLSLVCMLMLLPPVLAAALLKPAFQDNLAQRVQMCSACHGEQGRAGPDGYYPRIAGKPAAYLYNQLKNFQTGKRRHNLMSRLVANLSDTYLMEIAQYFSALDLPYVAPPAPRVAVASLARGRQLALQGDGQGFGQLGLTDAGLAFQQQGALEFQGQKNGRGQTPVGEITRRPQGLNQRVNRRKIVHKPSKKRPRAQHTGPVTRQSAVLDSSPGTAPQPAASAR